MSIRQNINGILLLDKPIGISSNGALQRVKRLFNAKKAGHTGSLDPLATGMLPLCFGEATKFSQYLLDSDKTYYVKAQLGNETTTGDGEGAITRTRDVSEVTEERIKQTLQSFLGQIDQVPPMFSALKHQGKPLYELARQGIEVERKSRQITIYNIQFHAYENNQLSFDVSCSKGTYVRTLVEDIGNQLNCGAHVIELRRTSVNPYQHAVMYTLPALEEIAAELGSSSLLSCLLPMETSIKHLPAISLSASSAYYLRMGQSIKAATDNACSLVRLISENDSFLGVGEILSDGTLKPHRLIAQ